MEFYILKNRQMPWGDYGEILYAGYNQQDKETGNFYILRTAPFVHCVYRDPRQAFLFVTDTLKKKLEQSSLKGLAFQQCVKERIVSLAWEKWDLSAPEPAVYPSGDRDAEEYIVRRKHNEHLAGAMETIWAVTFPEKGLLTGKGELVIQSIGDSDIFTAEINSGNILSEHIFVSGRAMRWLTEYGEKCVRFEPCAVITGTDEEIAKLKKSAEEKRFRQEKSEKMTDKDWQLWHRLITESGKLLGDMDKAKKEATRARWKKKALDNLMRAREMYPLQDKESGMIESLLRDE